MLMVSLLFVLEAFAILGLAEKEISLANLDNYKTADPTTDNLEKPIDSSDAITDNNEDETESPKSSTPTKSTNTIQTRVTITTSMPKNADAAGDGNDDGNKEEANSASTSSAIAVKKMTSYSNAISSNSQNLQPKKVIIKSPAEVVVKDTFEIWVYFKNGEPVVVAKVYFVGDEAETDSKGHAKITAPAIPGKFLLIVKSKEGYEGAKWISVVKEEEDTDESSGIDNYEPANTDIGNKYYSTSDDNKDKNYKGYAKIQSNNNLLYRLLELLRNVRYTT